MITTAAAVTAMATVAAAGRPEIFRQPDGYWLTDPPDDPFTAVEDFHYRFLDWHSLENRNHFCLHGAAVRLGDGLVVFPSKKKAGKSTLVSELARQGETVFCDDVPPVDPESWHGIAFGIQPRVRCRSRRSSA